MTETSLFAPAGADLFELAGRKFVYERSEYNSTAINERAVEVPVAIALFGKALWEKKQALEVGAVLPHYVPRKQNYENETIIDLYEVYPGVINADVLTWQPPHPFDLIISISTLDHLLDYSDFIEALERLTSWLTPGGLLFVTLPYGQPESVGGGEWLDTFLVSLVSGYFVEHYKQPALLRPTIWRMNKIDVTRHLWAQANLEDVSLAYHGQSLFANSVYFLLWGDVERWWHI